MNHDTGDDARANGAGKPSVLASWKQVYPDEFREGEEKALEDRATALNSSNDGGSADRRRLGMALSGGGIRSATFCLGVLQQMVRTRATVNGLSSVPLLRQVHFLSTVSGGGFVGGFLGALFVRGKPDQKETGAGEGEPCGAPEGEKTDAKAQQENESEAKKDPQAVLCAVEEVESCLGDNESKEVRWLRENGRYLAPNGSGDVTIAAAIHLRNWLSVLLLVALTILPVFLLVPLLIQLVSQMEPVENILRNGFARPAAGFWWWSPGWALAGVAAIATAAAGGAYWIATAVSLDMSPAKRLVQIARVALFVLPWPILWLAGDRFDGRYLPAAIVLTAVAIVALLFYLVACWKAGAIRSAPTVEGLRRMRNVLSRSLKICLVVFAMTAAYALIDSAGQSLFVRIVQSGIVATLFFVATGLAALLPAVRAVWGWVTDAFGGERPKLSVEVVATAIAIALLLLFLLNVNLVAQGIAWRWSLPPESASLLDALRVDMVVFFLLALLLAWAGGHLPFINFTSANALYGARLARAYLGASNFRRHENGALNVTEPIGGDDLAFDDYRPHECGGPIHIINTTFNETVSGKSKLENRDRQGMAFAVGPAGISSGRRHHAKWCADDPPGGKIEPVGAASETSFRMFPEVGPVESLGVAHWAAISGAAVGTGLGGRTSFGLSLLAGIANIRLGYWWDSGIEPEARFFKEGDPQLKRMRLDLDRLFARVFPAQSYLFDEWFANFHGPHRRHWHLSDGGHFENTAVYELLRRRLSHILCCDCGADPRYGFADIANLVRKARIDFGAEIRFLSRQDLAKRNRIEIPEVVLNNLDAPETFISDEARPHALLASVRYCEGPPAASLILFLKPALSGDEPVDLQEYQARHDTFPQECTSDQFFNEAQWESYRKLGEHTAHTILKPTSAGSFWFTALNPDDF